MNSFPNRNDAMGNPACSVVDRLTDMQAHERIKLGRRFRSPPTDRRLLVTRPRELLARSAFGEAFCLDGHLTDLCCE